MEVLKLTVILLLFGFLDLRAQPVNVTVTTIPEYDVLFTRTSGWTGGDGASSAPLSAIKTLWFFSDSQIGKVRNNRHVDGWMVNNVVGLQVGKDPANAQLRFFWGPNKNGKPTAFLVPKDSQEPFWIFEALIMENGLYLFLQSTQKTKDDGFTHSGTSLAHIANPHDDPPRWRINIRRLPFGNFVPRGGTLYGSAVLRDKGYVYIYGAEEEQAFLHPKHMVAARVPESDINNFEKWRFYSNGVWQPDHSKATRIARDVANEYSVLYQPILKRYIMVNSEELSKNIVLRTAPTPIGPWSVRQIIFECPQMDWDKRIFCYEAEAHPHLSSEADELILSYLANSSDFFHMLSDARIYRPRFLKLKFGN